MKRVAFVLFSLTVIALMGFSQSHADEFVPTGDMLTPRRSHCSARMPDGRVLVAGGNSNTLSTPLSAVEIYDPDSGTFSATGSLSVPRGRDPECIALNDGRVLVMGGGTARFVYTDTAEVWNPTTGTFTPTGRMSAGYRLAIESSRNTVLSMPHTKSLWNAGILIRPSSILEMRLGYW